MTWTCPYGGCDAYGYCLCAEDDELAARLDEAALCGELLMHPPLRRIETVPISIDDYEPQGS